MQTPKRHQI